MRKRGLTPPCATGWRACGVPAPRESVAESPSPAGATAEMIVPTASPQRVVPASNKGRRRLPNSSVRVISMRSAGKVRSWIARRSSKLPVSQVVRLKQDRQAVVDLCHHLVLLSHRAGIDRPPFPADTPEAAPGEDLVPLQRKPRAGLAPLRAFFGLIPFLRARFHDQERARMPRCTALGLGLRSKVLRSTATNPKRGQ